MNSFKSGKDLRHTFENRIRAAKEQVTRIQSIPPSDNDAAVVMFMANCFPVDSIIPRVTVLPYDAWLAFGRHVRKGETSTRITVWIPATRKEDAGNSVNVTRQGRDGGEQAVLRPVDPKVFHIAQTDGFERPAPDFWELTPDMQSALALCSASVIPAVSDHAQGSEHATAAA